MAHLDMKSRVESGSRSEPRRGPRRGRFDVYEMGDAYCFVGMERSTDLVLAFHLGKRDRIATEAFVSKLRYATSDSRFQITTDGFKPYVNAVDMILGDRVDFAQLVKVYTSSREGQQRYSPGEVVDAVPVRIMGRPEDLYLTHRTPKLEHQNGNATHDPTDECLQQKVG
jgi:hypothetical protein